MFCFSAPFRTIPHLAGSGLPISASHADLLTTHPSLTAQFPSFCWRSYILGTGCDGEYPRTVTLDFRVDKACNECYQFSENTYGCVDQQGLMERSYQLRPGAYTGGPSYRDNRTGS